jgi:hypothetical protein
MHLNEQLLTKLFQCLNAHDHKDMSECYHDDATFGGIGGLIAGRVGLIRRNKAMNKLKKERPQTF